MWIIQRSNWGTAIPRLRKLKTFWVVPPSFLLANSLVGAISNIDYIVGLLRKIRAMPVYNEISAFMTSGIGNLVCAITGILWLAYLIVRREPTYERPGETELARKIERRNGPHTTVQAESLMPPRGGGEVLISPLMGTGDQSICVKFTNLTPRPIINCEYSLSNLQRWSDAQKTYLIRSKSFEPVYIPGPKILEPETPTGFEIFSNRSGFLFFEGRRDGGIDPRNERGEPNTTWRIHVSVNANQKKIYEKRIYFKVIDSRKLALVGDPEAPQEFTPHS